MDVLVDPAMVEELVDEVVPRVLDHQTGQQLCQEYIPECVCVCTYEGSITKLSCRMLYRCYYKAEPYTAGAEGLDNSPWKAKF